MSQRFPGRRLSIVRLVALGATVALVGTGAVLGWSRFSDARAASTAASFFAGYVDVTATPSYPFEAGAMPGGRSVVLSFIVADPKSACKPSWGAAYGLGEAGTSMDLDRRIARFTRNGGEVSVSFGGAANSELATVCTDAQQLKNAYEQVIDRYDLTTIDLDVEGDNLSDPQAGQRRAEAIAAVQKDRRAAGRPLNVWLTLPVATTGLTESGTTAVRQMLAADVNLTGVNVMTMDFNTGVGTSRGMLDASISAADATHAQLAALYTGAGVDLGADTLWRKIGLTPMIGQNDVPGEVFGLDAAAGLNAYARKKGIGRVSLWSLNRDATCGANYPDVTRVSDGCSGVNQGSARFAQVLGQGITGPEDSAVATPKSAPTAAPVVDNPATSPYPIWSPEASYVADDRVVWHGNVYSAKWWTLDDLPDNPAVQAADTPWILIGPVLPGDRPAPVIVVPAGTYPAWSAAPVYEKGNRVLFEGRILESKWWNQGESPRAALEGSSSSPWIKLKDDEVLKILAARQTTAP
jgi:chitinase